MKQTEWITPEQWVRALRSGKYDQTRGRLCLTEDANLPCYDDPDTTKAGYCCLGVLCEESGLEYRVDKSSSIKLKEYFVVDANSYPYKLRSSIDSEVAPEWFSGGDAIYHVVMMNDNGKSFDEIADWVEENIINEGSSQ